MEAIETRQSLWDSMEIKQDITNLNGKTLVQNVPINAQVIANTMFRNKERYKAIAKAFTNVLPWWFVAVIHHMECSLNFNKYLGNGQDLNKVTTIVPKGRGPFESFEAGAIDALKLDGIDKITDWSLGNVLYHFEKFNGLGYVNHGINSPYIWSGTNQYTAGKYVTDGKYDENAVSVQIGIAPILKILLS